MKSAGGGMPSASDRGGSLISKKVISPANPVPVALYIPQQVFVSSLARSISDCCFSPHLPAFFAASTVSPPVAAKAIVPGMKQTK